MKALGDRMKNNYEHRSRFYLTRRTPVIMRLDGRAFHSLTKKCKRPFDKFFIKCMENTVMEIIPDIQGAVLAYIQSDEVSFLIKDFDKLQSDAWFDYNIQKMTSIAAAQMSVVFNKYWGREVYGLFDCRVFNIPKEEVCNYFIWRQKDWMRNSLNMLARSVFSHKELQGKKSQQIHEMLHGKGIDWAELDNMLKNGTVIFKFVKNWTRFYNFTFKNYHRYFEEHLLKGEE